MGENYYNECIYLLPLILKIKSNLVVQSPSHVRFFVIPWTAALQACQFFTVYRSLLKFMSIESVTLFNHLILCCPLLLLSSIIPSISCSLAQLCLTLCNPHGLQHARFPCPSLSPGACSNSRSLSWWCHPTISSSVTPFSFRQGAWVQSGQRGCCNGDWLRGNCGACLRKASVRREHLSWDLRGEKEWALSWSEVRGFQQREKQMVLRLGLRLAYLQNRRKASVMGMVNTKDCEH